jgi:hypothetical protein
MGFRYAFVDDGPVGKTCCCSICSDSLSLFSTIFYLEWEKRGNASTAVAPREPVERRAEPRYYTISKNASRTTFRWLRREIVQEWNLSDEKLLDRKVLRDPSSQIQYFAPIDDDINLMQPLFISRLSYVRQIY